MYPEDEERLPPLAPLKAYLLNSSSSSSSLRIMASVFDLEALTHSTYSIAFSCSNSAIYCSNLFFLILPSFDKIVTGLVMKVKADTTHDHK